MRCRVKQRAIALDLRVLCDSAGGGGCKHARLRVCARKGLGKWSCPESSQQDNARAIQQDPRVRSVLVFTPSRCGNK